MKKVLLAAAALGLTATGAAAQYYDLPRRPPPAGIYAAPPASWRHARPYSWCEAKARRLHEFEYRVQMDGRVSRDEARIANGLRADLSASCGNGRWAPNRGWYYR